MWCPHLWRSSDGVSEWQETWKAPNEATSCLQVLLLENSRVAKVQEFCLSFPPFAGQKSEWLLGKVGSSVNNRHLLELLLLFCPKLGFKPHQSPAVVAEISQLGTINSGFELWTKKQKASPTKAATHSFVCASLSCPPEQHRCTHEHPVCY